MLLRARTHFAAFVTLLALSLPAFAQGAWEYRVTPYVWLPTMDTSTSIDGSPTVDTSRPILEVLETAALVAVQARRTDLTLFGELNYLDLGDAAESSDGSFRADLNLEGVVGAFSVGYALFDNGNTRLEALAGVRAWHLETSADFTNIQDRSTTRSWVDPIIGGRAEFEITEKMTAHLLADIGGFGIGSEFQVEAIARTGYEFTDTISGVLGWRHLYTDIDDGRLNLELTLSGPFIAIDFRF